MKHGLTCTLRLILLGVAGIAVGPADADTVAAGPYYATPSWDQKLPASTRFIVLSNWNNEAVLDRETGLVWEKSPETIPGPWSASRFQCATKNVGGRKGWRLPAFGELASLIDPSVSSPDPTLPVGHPFTAVQSLSYWTATTEGEFPARKWTVHFGNTLVSTADEVEPHLHWCVRSTIPLDNY